MRFVKHLLCHMGGKLLIIWDGAPIHRDQAIKAFLATSAARQLCLEQLPGYAPDLNPDEGVWNHLKNVELRNVSCHDQDELRHEALGYRTTAAQARSDLRFHQAVWILDLNVAISR